MVDYTVIKNSAGIIMSIRRDDGASIPTDSANADYQNYLTETEGMTLEEVIIPNPEPVGPSNDARITAIEMYLLEQELGL